MKRSIIFVLVVSVNINLAAQNLAINPGFEEWETINKPSGWTLAQSCAKEDAILFSGSSSCLQSAGSESMSLSQRITVTPGKLYTLTINYLTSPLTQGNGCRLWCRWVDATGTLFDDAATKAQMQSDYFRSTTWNTHTITITAPPAAASINLLIRTLPYSTTYWDDIRFEEATPTLATTDDYEGIIIYPVPAGECLHIKNITGISRLEILNLAGSVLKSVSVYGQPECTIHTGDLSIGVYMIRFYHEENIITMLKFIR